jgi:riboflavin kinase/FMN adenylyltransferase
MIIFDTKDISVTTETSVILGNFDGVHLAHQKLFELSNHDAKQRGLKSLVFTFNPHPQSFFGNENFKAITTKEEKRMLFSSLGMDYAVEYPFDKDTMNMEAELFFEEVLLKRLNAKVISVGEDYRFGKGRRGNRHLLFDMCENSNIKLNVLPEMVTGSEAISSTAIRKYISENKLYKAADMLGRPYFVMGEISHGKKLGRSIGFPTINFKSESGKLYPPGGVYITETEINGKKYKSVTNIGNRPTVGGFDSNTETHLLDFEGDIYGQSAVVFFLERIRDEKRFETTDELGRQISEDIDTALSYFRSRNAVPF